MDRCYTHYNGRTVLVTGSAGAIGSNLSKRLAQLGARVLAVDDFSGSEAWNAPFGLGMQFVQSDILNEAEMVSVFESGPQIVFHLAAFFANQNSIEFPERDLLVNGMGTLRLLELSRRFNVQRFVYASSSSIYGNANGGLREERDPGPLTSPYQITKRLGEDYCNFFFEYHGLSIVKARLFNSYGPGDIPGRYRSVIPNLIYLALKKQPLPITGTGKETRDFTFVDDVVDGLIRTAVLGATTVRDFNICTGVETEINSLAEMINQLTGNPSGLSYHEQRKWDAQKRRKGSYELAQEIIGFSPQIALESGLRRTIEWFCNNWNNIDNSVSSVGGGQSQIRE